MMGNRTLNDKAVRPAAVLALILLWAGCAPSRERFEPERAHGGGFKVSVSSDGEPVSDFKTPLVHRISLSSAQLGTIFNPSSRTINLPFHLKREVDLRGGVKGVRITGARTNADGSGWLGLKENDLVTAVGRRHARSQDDLWQLYESLSANRAASLTFERDGRPHKILYSLDKERELG